MKRIIALCLAFIMALSLCACGTNSETPTDNPANPETSSNSQKEGYKKDPDLPGTVRVGLTTVKYCVDAPGTLTKRANTGHIVEMGSYFVIYDQYVDLSSNNEFGVDHTTIKSPEDVLEAMKAQMSATVQNGLIFADEYNINVANKETVTVNGWKMCKSSGTVNLACEYPLEYESADFIAYSLIKDGYPVYFAVVEKPNGEMPINIEDMADKIAKTFREYEE